MNVKRTLAVALLALGLAGPVSAQQAAPGQPDQVDQLARAVNLNDDQKQEIRKIMENAQSEIDKLREEALAVQEKLQEQVGPDYDEQAIRKQAERLGDLTGEMTALSILLQARVESVFTEEQRAELEKKIQEQRAMQEQIQKQMQQQQQRPPQQQSQ
jgi:protein CpxP